MKVNLRVHEGVDIYRNGQTISIFHNDIVPNSSSVFSSMGVGSIYVNTSNGTVFIKKTNTNNATDWIELGSVNLNPNNIFLQNYIPNPIAISVGDSLEDSIGKLGGMINSILESIGIIIGQNDLGVFSGNIIADNSNVKSALSQLESTIESIGLYDFVFLNVSSSTQVDITNRNFCKWMIYIQESQNREYIEINALKNSTNVVFNAFSRLRVGSVINYTRNVSISGNDMILTITPNSTTINIVGKRLYVFG